LPRSPAQAYDPVRARLTLTRRHIAVLVPAHARTRASAALQVHDKPQGADA